MSIRGVLARINRGVIQSPRSESCEMDYDGASRLVDALVNGTDERDLLAEEEGRGPYKIEEHRNNYDEHTSA